MAPRVILVMSDQWPRALIRASLRDVGYDAIGARSIAEAWTHPRHDPSRGDVALIVFDQDTLQEHAPGALRELMHFHGDPQTMLIAHATRARPTGTWTHVMHRPLSVGELVSAVQRAIPLAVVDQHPLDQSADSQ